MSRAIGPSQVFLAPEIRRQQCGPARIFRSRWRSTRPPSGSRNWRHHVEVNSAAAGAPTSARSTAMRGRGGPPAALRDQWFCSGRIRRGSDGRVIAVAQMRSSGVQNSSGREASASTNMRPYQRQAPGRSSTAAPRLWAAGAAATTRWPRGRRCRSAGRRRRYCRRRGPCVGRRCSSAWRPALLRIVHLRSQVSNRGPLSLAVAGQSSCRGLGASRDCEWVQGLRVGRRREICFRGRGSAATRDPAARVLFGGVRFVAVSARRA